MIVDIIGKEIEKYGFIYGLEKAYDGSGIWGFTREVQGIKQRISIQQHRFTKGLFLNFGTSAWQVADKRAGGSLKISGGYSNQRDLWYYETEEDFKRILMEFLDIIENYGLKELEIMSIESEIIPTAEMGEKLISSAEELSNKFIQDNHIVNLEMNEDTVLEWFKLVEAKFKQAKNLPYDDGVKDMLLEIVAFLGEQLKKELQGEWLMGIDPRVILLESLRTRPFSGYFPLKSIVEAWAKSNISDFKEQYLTFLRNKV